MSTQTTARRPRRRALNAERRSREPVKQRPVWPGLVGGQYKPLTDHEMERIHHTVLNLMEQVGFAQAIPSMIETVTAAGGWMNDQGRLCFPRSMVEDIIASTARTFVLSGLDSKYDLELGGRRVHTGTGGAAPMVVDLDTGRYRESNLLDVYDIARLVDTLDNIHYYWRSVVARDMPTTMDLDVNTSYASMHGTTKHIGVSYVDGENVRAAIAMYDMLLGGEGEFRKKPFCTISCCHVVPPMRFAEESCDAFEAAVRGGMPVMVLAAGQAGATSPTALAGSIVQSVAEVLAGVIWGNLIDPNCRTIFGTWPFVSDLRTGAMCSGSAELALIAAGCAQMAGYYDLPGAVAAGMSDSKVADAQSGAEKGYTTALAAHAGASMIMESAGMQGSLMGASYESYVIDNDTLGAVQRTVRGIEVTDETLSFEVIRDVVHGEGHYLGHSQTIERMETDYFYPEIGDRNSPADWEERGAKDVRERAKEKVRQVLNEHYPSHIDRAVDDKIRANFNIMLPREMMERGKRFW